MVFAIVLALLLTVHAVKKIKNKRGGGRERERSASAVFFKGACNFHLFLGLPAQNALLAGPLFHAKLHRVPGPAHIQALEIKEKKKR